MAYNVSAINDLNTVPDYFNPYNALTINMVLTFSETNLAPTLVHNFS